LSDWVRFFCLFQTSFWVMDWGIICNELFYWTSVLCKICFIWY